MQRTIVQQTSHVYSFHRNAKTGARMAAALDRELDVIGRTIAIETRRNRGTMFQPYGYEQHAPKIGYDSPTHADVLDAGVEGPKRFDSEAPTRA